MVNKLITSVHCIYGFLGRSYIVLYSYTIYIYYYIKLPLSTNRLILRVGIGAIGIGNKIHTYYINSIFPRTLNKLRVKGFSFTCIRLNIYIIMLIMVYNFFFVQFFLCHF